jgi:hypothetical protein
MEGKVKENVRQYRRIIIGTDAPSGTGAIPLGVLRGIPFLVSLCEVKAEEEAIAMTTGDCALKLF